jgi:hypothetical protein
MKTITLKLLALIFGSSLWYIFSQSRTDTISLDIPLCFYGTEKIIRLDAPEKIHITLCGMRSDLASLDIEQLVAHVDACKLNPKAAYITIESHNIFLPTTIKLVHYSPAPIPVHVELQDKLLL